MFPSLVLALAPLAAPAQSTALPGSTGAQDETARGYAVVEVRGPERSPYVGERFTVRLRGGADVEVLEANLVQPFRQRLDVPVQLEHPWFTTDPTAPAPTGPPRFALETERLAEIAVGAQRVEASRYVERVTSGPRSGQSFDFVEVERRFVADAPGTLLAPEPKMTFAYATEFRDDLVAGRVPTDRNDAFVRGGELRIEVQPLPEEGRPFSFTGAVGRFEVEARLSALTVEVGETVQLDWTIRGEPDVSRVLAPEADRLEGFQLVGTTEARGRGELEVSYIFMALDASIDELPSLEFSSFDPELGEYVVHDTDPIAIAVEAAMGGMVKISSGAAASSPSSTGAGGSAPSFRMGISALALIGVVAVILILVAVAAGGKKR